MAGKYHFLAIGGIGQSALAKMLLERGFEVSGSDISDSKYLTKLHDLGAKIFIGHSAENVPKNATVVVSTAIPDGNPELERAKELGLEIIHRSDMLKLLSAQYEKFIGFSGTHGKTTTSGLCAYVMAKMGANPGFAIGGIVPELGTNGAGGDGTYFVAELDESDGTILKYSPSITVINNLEADHFDFFKNGLVQVLDTFNEYLAKLPDTAKVIINKDDEPTCKLNFLSAPTTFSLFNSAADYFAKDVSYANGLCRFDVVAKGKCEGQIELTVPGEHNVYNALATIAALMESGFKFDDFAAHFKTFSGMGRRFQLVAEFEGIRVIDDYAHHPTEIVATLKAARQYTESRVVAVFQPHRYSRFQGLWDEFLNAFKECDLLVATDVYPAGEKPVEGYSSGDFVKQINHPSCLHVTGDIKTAGAEIFKLLKPSDVVLTFGAGDITKMGEVLNEKYEQQVAQTL
jgi:UDP-N-acetylmuramate--alanine ligase